PQETLRSSIVLNGSTYVTQAPINSVGFQLRAGCTLQDGDWRHHPNGFITLFEMDHKFICQNELVSIGVQKNSPFFYFLSVIRLCSYGHFFYQLWRTEYPETHSP